MKEIEEFKKICKKSLQIMQQKNEDYSGNDTPFAAFELCDRLLDISVPTGFFVRMCDKISRVSNLMLNNKKNNVLDESITDTIIDLINYLVLFAAYIEYKNSKHFNFGQYTEKLFDDLIVFLRHCYIHTEELMWTDNLLSNIKNNISKLWKKYKRTVIKKDAQTNMFEEQTRNEEIFSCINDIF